LDRRRWLVQNQATFSGMDRCGLWTSPKSASRRSIRLRVDRTRLSRQRADRDSRAARGWGTTDSWSAENTPSGRRRARVWARIPARTSVLTGQPALSRPREHGPLAVRGQAGRGPRPEPRAREHPATKRRPTGSRSVRNRPPGRGDRAPRARLSARPATAAGPSSSRRGTSPPRPRRESRGHRRSGARPGAADGRRPLLGRGW